MEIKALNEKQFQEYDDFLLTEENSLIYYSLKYKNFLKELLRAHDNYWVALDGGRLCGILPLFYKEGIFGKVYNSLPFYGSNGGIIADSQHAFQALSDKYNDIISGDDVAAANLISNPLIRQDYSKIKHSLIEARIGQFTSLNYPDNVQEALLKSFCGKTRNMIRKAAKSDINVIVDNCQLDFLKETHKENMKAIGAKPKSDLFFELLSKYFKEGIDYNVYVAMKDSQKISALLLLYFNRTVEYFTPVIKEDYRSLQPLSLIIFTSMQDSIKRGYKLWNWGGTWLTQDGVYQFKNSWGAQSRVYNYYIEINNGEIYDCPQEKLMEEYKNFFVVPFSRLHEVREYQL